MPSWREFETEAPELAARARRLLDEHEFKILATSRRDGSPRASGIELIFADDGELYTGSMWQAVKALDLRRDPRFAVHSCPPPQDRWQGDAKLAGTFVEIDDDAVKARVVGGERPSGPFHLFRADLREVVVVGLDDERTAMVIESWHPGRGVRRRTR
jgi:hypothetical protein